MVHLYIHLLINANNEDGEWRGIKVKKGQIITGLHSLNSKTHISIRKLRTCLDRLEKTGEIDIQTTNKYSLITICKYDTYQYVYDGSDKQNDKPATSKRQATDNKQDIKIIDIKKKEEEREKRSLAFKKELGMFQTVYPIQMLKDFYEYWTELNPSKTKMRFELQTTFEIKKRLVTWAGKEKGFTSKAVQPAATPKLVVTTNRGE